MRQAQKTRRHQHRTHMRQARQQNTWQAKKTSRNLFAGEQRNLIFRLQKTITHYFPTLYKQLREVVPSQTRV